MTVLFFCHIQTEMLAGFQIVEISVRIGLLFCYKIKEPLKVFAFEQFFDRSKNAVVDKSELCFLVCLQLFKRFSCLICPNNDVDIVVSALKQRFVCNQPFAEGFIRSAAF